LFVISRTLLNRGSLNRGSTVLLITTNDRHMPVEKDMFSTVFFFFLNNLKSHVIVYPLAKRSKEMMLVLETIYKFHTNRNYNVVFSISYRLSI